MGYQIGLLLLFLWTGVQPTLESGPYTEAFL